jgi:hypothetical protein
MYSADQPLAGDRWPPTGMPSQGWYNNGEITSEADTRPFVLHNDTMFPGMLETGIHAPLRRGYYSAVTWVDSQIGLALDALDASGLAETTWVTFMCVLPRPPPPTHTHTRARARAESPPLPPPPPFFCSHARRPRKQNNAARPPQRRPRLGAGGARQLGEAGAV